MSTVLSKSSAVALLVITAVSLGFIGYARTRQQARPSKKQPAKASAQAVPADAPADGAASTTSGATLDATRDAALPRKRSQANLFPQSGKVFIHKPADSPLQQPHQVSPTPCGTAEDAAYVQMLNSAGSFVGWKVADHNDFLTGMDFQLPLDGSRSDSTASEESDIWAQQPAQHSFHDLQIYEDHLAPGISDFGISHMTHPSLYDYPVKQMPPPDTQLDSQLDTQLDTPLDTPLEHLAHSPTQPQSPHQQLRPSLGLYDLPADMAEVSPQVQMPMPMPINNTSPFGQIEQIPQFPTRSAMADLMSPGSSFSDFSGDPPSAPSSSSPTMFSAVSTGLQQQGAGRSARIGASRTARTGANGETEFCCEFCDATFKVKGYLTRHAKKHAKTMAYKCPFHDPSAQTPCHSTGGFSRRDTYKTHLKSRHFKYPPGTRTALRKETPGNCGGCGAVFASNEDWIKQHVANNECPAIVSYDQDNLAGGSSSEEFDGSSFQEWAATEASFQEQTHDFYYEMKPEYPQGVSVMKQGYRAVEMV